MALRVNIGTLALAVVTIAGLLASADAAPTKGSPNNARYWVQSGAFKSRTNAEARCDLLKKSSYRFAVQSGPGGDGEPLFFCRSSQVLPYEKAVALAKQLRLKKPHDAMLVQRRPNGSLAPRADAKKSELPGDLERLSGRWCGDPVVYGPDPLQIWTVRKSGAITLQIAAGRTPSGQPEQVQGSVEKLPGNLIKLTGETAGFRSEAIYAIEDSGLRGVSFHQEIKDNSTSMTTIPDSLHRCP